MPRQTRLNTIGLSLGLLIFSLPVPTTGFEPVFLQDNPSLAPFVPSPYDVVQRMLTLAEVTRDDVVYDIGCGDGRIVQFTRAQGRAAAKVVCVRYGWCYRGHCAVATFPYERLEAVRRPEAR